MMLRALAVTLATAAIVASCDEPDSSPQSQPRYWGPEQIQLEAEFATPVLLVPLFQCFVSDEQPALIDYSDGVIGHDDKKTIEVCVSTRGHEDRGQCWREQLLKLGAEVVP